MRYDLEIIPLNEDRQSAVPGGTKNYPVDRNNFAPRIGFSRTFDDHGRSVLRGGYGIFYNRTILGAIDDVIEQSKFTHRTSSIFPTPAPTRPAAGRFPTDPLLVNGPVVNRALLEQMFPSARRSQECRRRRLRFAGRGSRSRIRRRSGSAGS